MTRIGSAGMLAVLLAVALAACGGSATASPAGDGDTGAGSGASAGSGTDAGSGAEAPAATEAAAGAPDSGTGNNGAAADDAAKVGDQLKPPNSTETSKTTTDTYWYVLYESTDSPDSLKGYYEGQIPNVGLKIISTTSTSGAYVWAIARDESGSFGGSVTVAPSGSGSGSSVIVAVGS